MTKHYQKGDAGAAMLIVMVVLMIGFFWHGGMGHGGDRGGHMSAAGAAAKSPLDLLDETYARGEIGREEYLRRREDLLKR
ncbi:MAG: SHOCT domain-containing protein [Hydrogenophilales bacterium]|nr:SHOCT domain-containing protein [Hydrogenophilales bacterium]